MFVEDIVVEAFGTEGVDEDSGDTFFAEVVMVAIASLGALIDRREITFSAVDLSEEIEGFFLFHCIDHGDAIFGAAGHVHIYYELNLTEGEERVFCIVAGADETSFFSAESHEGYGVAGRMGSKPAGEVEHEGSAGGIVVGAGEECAATHATEVVEMGGEDYEAVGLFRAGDVADDVFAFEGRDKLRVHLNRGTANTTRHDSVFDVEDGRGNGISGYGPGEFAMGGDEKDALR